MFSFANSMRISLMFALFILIPSFAVSAEIGVPRSMPSIATCFESTHLAIAADRAFGIEEVVASIATNRPRGDVDATNRRSTETHTPTSKLRCVRSLSESQCILIARSIFVPNQLEAFNSQLVKCEHLQAPANETRGKPEGHVIAALQKTELTPCPLEVKEPRKWSSDQSPRAIPSLD